MKVTLYSLFRTIHTWGGMTFALLLLLSSITGSLLIWKNELILLSFPNADVAFQATPELFAILANSVEQQFANDDIIKITFPSDNFPLLKVSLVDSRYAYLDLNGNIVDQWVSNERWEEWLYDLHHRLLMDNLGLTIIGLSGLAMSILVIVGIVSFWPMRKGLRQGFWPQKISRNALLKSHRNIGIFHALPLLMTLITGSALAFPEQVERYLLEPFRGDDYSMDFSHGVDRISGGNSGDWLPAIKRSLESFPGASIRTAEVPKTYSPYRIIGLKQADELSSKGLSKIYIESNNGWMDFRIDAQAQHLSERLYNSAYPLHSGSIDNFTYKLVLTFSGLLMTLLGVFGLYRLIKRISHLRQ